MYRVKPLEVALLGGGGFIGTYAAGALRQLGARVRVHTSPEQFDICDEAALRDFIDGADVVVHLAGPPSVARSFEESTEYVRAHAGGTASVVNAMRATGVRRIVYLSSAEVYGAAEKQPVREDSPYSPRSPYAGAKAAAELIVRASHNAGALSGFILRPFSVYGRGMHPDSLIGSLIRQAEKSADLWVADVRPLRDYVYAGDVARAIALAASHEQAELEVLNLCSGVRTSIAQIVDALQHVLGRNFTLRQRGEGRGTAEITRLTGDPHKAAATLEWAATTDLEAGLALTMPEKAASR